MGLQPDILVCRSEHPIGQDIKDKIALFCNVPQSHVLQNLDVEYLYEASLPKPLQFHVRHFHTVLQLLFS